MTHLREKMKSHVETSRGLRSASANARQHREGRDESGASVMSAPSFRSGATYSDSDSGSRQPSAAPVTPPAPLQGLSPTQRISLLDQTNNSMKGSISPRGLQAHLAQNSSVEAQAIAAKAVAMVVNSSRKGIVPLCADVANLIRINQALEKRVSLLVVENAALRSACSSGASPGATSGASCSPAASGSNSDIDSDGLLFSTVASTNNNPPSVSLSPPPPPSSLPDSDDSSSSSFSSPRSETINNNPLVSPSASSVSAAAASVKSRGAAAVVDTPHQHLPPSPPLSTSSTSSSPMQTSPRITVLATASSSSSSSSAFPASRSSCRFNDADLRPNRDEASRVNVDVIVHPQPTNPTTKTKTSKKKKNDGDDAMKLSHVQCDKKSESCDKERNAGKDGRPADVLFELAAAKEEIEALRHRLQELEMTHLAQSNPGISYNAVNNNNDNANDNNNNHDDDAVNIECVDEVEEVRLESIETIIADHFDHSILEERSSANADDEDDDDKSEEVFEDAEIVSLNCDNIRPIIEGDPAIVGTRSRLRGCKCESCLDVGKGDTRAESRAVPPSPCGLFLEIGDHVVARGNLTGYVAYMGHLDTSAYKGHLEAVRDQPKTIVLQSFHAERMTSFCAYEDDDHFDGRHQIIGHEPGRDLNANESPLGPTASVHVGLILDAPVGTHDGLLNGKRYFKCEKNYGVFVHLDDIQAVISPKKSDFSASNTKSHPRNEIQSTVHSTLSTKTTEDLSPPEHLLSATQSKVDEAREQQQRRHTTSHSDDAAPHGQQRRHPASRNHDAAPHKALSSSNPLSVVETELSSGAPLIASQTNDSRAPLRRCKKIKEPALSKPDEIIVIKDDAKSVVKMVDQIAEHASSSSSPASSLSLPPAAEHREKCNDDSATTLPRTNLPLNKYDPPSLRKNESTQSRSSPVVEYTAEVEREKRQGVPTDAGQTNKFTKRSSSAAASIRSSLSSLVGLSSSSKSKSSPPHPPSAPGTASKSSQPHPPSASGATSHLFRSSVFKNPLPFLPSHPALISPTNPALISPTNPALISPTNPELISPTNPALISPTNPALSPKSPLFDDALVAEAAPRKQQRKGPSHVRNGDAEMVQNITKANKGISDISSVNQSDDSANKSAGGASRMKFKASSSIRRTSCPSPSNSIERVASQVVWNEEIERNLDETRC